MNHKQELFKVLKLIAEENNSEAQKLLVSIVHNKSIKFLNESALPIKLMGSDVMINGKQVGSVNNDLKDSDADIEFVSTDGKKKKFENIQALYSYLTKKFELTAKEK